ncbi:hypothetical protein H6A03_07200 [[Clostridium] spiroforme]|nr:hypothetical protein [Thomasclavelia spiroformis]MBM6879564.1 hypothetical protein [Thomasclavelia spiroformis]
MKEVIPSAKNLIMKDGSMAWTVNYTAKTSDGHERKYKLLLVYNCDHPSLRYGQSVNVYFISPTFEELQKNLDRVVTDKILRTLPYTLLGPYGIRCLSLCDANVYRMPNCGMTASGYLRRTIKWINYYELALENAEIWQEMLPWF